jgi:hypothetical protein
MKYSAHSRRSRQGFSVNLRQGPRSLSEIAEVVLWFGFVGIGFWSMLTEANAEQPAVEHRLRPGTGFYRRRGFFLSSSARFKHVA